jgi:hypothetical protein
MSGKLSFADKCVPKYNLGTRESGFGGGLDPSG